MSKRYAARVDSNHKEIVKALRAHGAFVHNFGKVDLLVGYNGLWHVMEIKDGAKVESRQRLTKDEIIFILEVQNRAPVHLVRSVEDALKIVGVETNACV